MAVVARITLFMNRASHTLMGSPRMRREVIGRSLTPSSIEFLSIVCGRGNNLLRSMDSLDEQTAHCRRLAIVRDYAWKQSLIQETE